MSNNVDLMQYHTMPSLTIDHWICLVSFVRVDDLTHQPLKGLLGTAQVDTETSLLAILDKAIAGYGLKVNGSVTKRALKSLINEDFRLSNWQSLVTTSKQLIDDRYIDDGDDVTADAYYMLLCSQILQKMLRTATQKFKPKERT